MDHALALGVKHAALNFNLSQLLETKETPGNPTYELDGRKLFSRRRYAGVGKGVRWTRWRQAASSANFTRCG